MSTKTLLNTKITTITKNTKGIAGRMSFVPFALMLTFVSLVSAQQPQRIISLVPNVTEMLYAIGAGPQIVAVSSYDHEPPAVRTLPRVGALVDPDTERILSLKPDLVITYGSQTDLQSQLRRASIGFFDYRHGGLDDIMTTMRDLGARTGHRPEADRVARELETRLSAIRARVAGRPRPKTMLVFGREPRALRNIYASGGRGFLHDMLTASGGDNVFADIDRESVQATTELILSRAPEVILELHADDFRDREGIGRQLDIESWAPLSSVPAVKNRRVIILTGSGLVVPGPRVADSIEQMAQALHP